MEMLFGNVNVGGADASLQVLPKIFQSVDVRIADNVFAGSVIDRLVIVASFFQTPVGAQLVSVNRRTVENVFLNDWLKRLAFAVWHNLRHYLSLALQHSKDNAFTRRAATANAGTLAANVGFVNLNVSKQWPFIINLRHVLADKVCHAPRCLVGHAKLTFQFLCGNAVARGGEKVNRIEPKSQRCPAVFKERSSGGVNVMTAPLAGISAFGLNPKPVRFAVAFRAGKVLTKTAIKNVLQTGFIIWKFFPKFPNCHTGLFFLRFHASNICQTVTYVKGIIP